MRKIEFNKRIEIATSDDMVFSVQATKTQLTDAGGTHDSYAEIVLLIEDAEKHKEMATLLSTTNIDRLITELHTLNERVKGYNRSIKG